jgi:hypothetical protein
VTKKEANAILRWKYGTSWFDRPGVKDERNALMRGSAQQKVPVTRQRGTPTVSSSPAPTPAPLPLLRAGGTLQSGTQLRPFVVVEVAPGTNRAFYMSTGTGGVTDAGEWTLFGGVAGEGHMGKGWLIKAREGKRVKKYQKIAVWLTKNVGATAQEAAQFTRDRGWPFILTTTEGWGSQVNRILGAHKAIEPYAEGGEATRQFYAGYAGRKWTEAGGIFLAHPRAAFNPRTPRRPLRRACDTSGMPEEVSLLDIETGKVTEGASEAFRAAETLGKELRSRAWPNPPGGQGL